MSFQTCSASPARWPDLLEISAGKPAAAATERGCAEPWLCSLPVQPAHRCPAVPALPSCATGQKGKHCQSPADSKHALPFEAFKWIWLGWWQSLRSTQTGMQKVLALGGRAVCRRCQLPTALRSGRGSRYLEPEESPHQAGGSFGQRALIPSPADVAFPCCVCRRSSQICEKCDKV